MAQIPRQIPGFPDYAIDASGTVSRTVDCVTKHGQVLYKAGKVLRPAIKNGYRFVVLYDEKRVRKNVFVHQLVARTFLGSTDGLVINHLDGNRLNNNVGNIEICTQQRNQQHMVEMHQQYGENMFCAKLTSDQVSEIKRRRRAGEKLRVLAADFGVGMSNISHICTGRNWKRHASPTSSSTIE